MSGKVGPFKARDVVRALKKLEFRYVRQTGSHAIYEKDGHDLIASVPVHPSQEIKKGTLGNIIRASGVDAEEFARLAKK